MWKSLNLNTWYKCNYNCIFCVIWWIQNEFKTEDFVSIKEIKNINLDWYNSVWLTWWEPTIHPDFFSILDYLVSKWLKIHIQTNWYMLWVDSFFYKIKNYSINYQVNFNNLNEKLYNVAMWAKWDMYINAIKWIKNILNTNNNLIIKIIINKFNYKSILNTVEFFNRIWVKKFYIAYPVLKWTYKKYLDKLIVTYSELSSELKKLLLLEKKLWIKYILDSFPYCIVNQYQYKNIYEVHQFKYSSIENIDNSELFWLSDIMQTCLNNWNKNISLNCDNCEITKFKIKFNNLSLLHNNLNTNTRAVCLDNLHKIKPNKCLNCKYNIICTWISKEYYNIIWDREINELNIKKDLNKKDIIKYINYVNKI